MLKRWWAILLELWEDVSWRDFYRAINSLLEVSGDRSATTDFVSAVTKNVSNSVDVFYAIRAIDNVTSLINAGFSFLEAAELSKDIFLRRYNGCIKPADIERGVITYNPMHMEATENSLSATTEVDGERALDEFLGGFTRR